jgi:hypothetical protein
MVRTRYVSRNEPRTSILRGTETYLSLAFGESSPSMSAHHTELAQAHLS